MAVGSINKCNTCHMEYHKLTDEKECIARVKHCKDMINGQIDKC